MVWLDFLKEFSVKIIMPLYSFTLMSQSNTVIVNNFSLEKFNIQAYRQDVASVNWVEMKSMQSFNENWSFVRDSLTLILTNSMEKFHVIYLYSFLFHPLRLI